MPCCKEAIVKSIWLAGIFTLGICVLGSLWSGLAALGDVRGAGFTRGVFWGVVICWGLNGIGLIGLLTANALSPTPAPIAHRTTDN